MRVRDGRYKYLYGRSTKGRTNHTSNPSYGEEISNDDMQRASAVVAGEEPGGRRRMEKRSASNLAFIVHAHMEEFLKLVEKKLGRVYVCVRARCSKEMEPSSWRCA